MDTHDSFRADRPISYYSSLEARAEAELWDEEDWLAYELRKVNRGR